MLKNILGLILSLLLLQSANAENRDTLRSYFKNSGQKVAVQDSFDYYRVILPPDSDIDKDLYRIYEFYSNGKPKCVATSFTSNINPVLDGNCVNFFMNGKRQSVAQYKNGRLSGSATTYYPNGKLYCIFKIDDFKSRYYSKYYGGYFNEDFQDLNSDYNLKIVELRDSTGNILTANGTGHVIIFDNDFKKVTEEGELKDYRKEGIWEGPIADSGKYICIFHKDEFKSGTSYMKSGNRYTFKQIYTDAVFSDGMNAFYLFIQKNLQYPESAKRRKVMGTVTVEFYVETNGTLSDVKIHWGVLKSLDDEAIRVISLSPLWIPAYKFGIPIRTYHTVPVSFYHP